MKSLSGAELGKLAEGGFSAMLGKGWWQTGEETKIKAQQSNETWLSTSLKIHFSGFRHCVQSRLDARSN